MAVWIDWARLLVAGDYLSPVEIPMISEAAPRAPISPPWPGSSRSSSRPTHVVRATATPIDPAPAAAILREDRAYVQALRDHGADAKLPLARRTAAQKVTHASNAAQFSSAELPVAPPKRLWMVGRGVRRAGVLT